MLIRSFLSKLLNLMKSSRVAFAISLFFSVSSIDLFSMARNQAFQASHARYTEQRQKNKTPGPLFGDVLKKIQTRFPDDKIKKYGPLFGDALIPVVGGGTRVLPTLQIA